MNITKQKTVTAGFLVLIFSILGKIVSFVREISFSAVFGTTNLTDAYFSANVIPSILNIPITISALMFFIPLYNDRRVNNGYNAANVFSSNVLNVFTLITICLTIFVQIFAPLLIRLVAPGFDEETFKYSVELLRLLCLSFPITLVTSVFINISNANQKHFSPQLLVVINSSITILAILFLAPKYGIYVVPISGLVAWFFQLFLQHFFIKDMFTYKFVINFKDPYLRKIIILAIPVIIASFAEQINLMVTNILCSQLGEGSISIINYALRILNLVNGTITIAILTVMYPVFSLLMAQKDYSKFSQSFNSSIKICLLTVTPLAVLCLIGGFEIIKTIYYRGNMMLDAVTDISVVFIFYSIGIIFIALREIYVRIFYTLNNSILPMYISLGCSTLNILLNILLIKKMGISGVALGASISNILYFVLVRSFLVRKFSFVSYSIEKKFYKELCLALLASIIIWYLYKYFFYIDNIAYFFIASCLTLGMYVLILYLLKNREMIFLISGIKDKVNMYINRK